MTKLSQRCEIYGRGATLKLIWAALAFCSAAGAVAQTRLQPVPPLKNPVLLNIGFVCRWQSHCITKQRQAMRTSLKHVKTRKIPAWKIQLCNRNASRNGTRKDWVGFNRCIRNPALGRPPLRRKKRPR